ncbi:MAG TPA: DUF1287 domain-containing protein [Candidatus Rifleibacterium sp.]|nr:DUF1287 domain-containing protein [Candidatus Rifleibacterium sp.]
MNHFRHITRLALLALVVVFLQSTTADALPPASASALIAAARGQIGVTTVYDPAYVRLAYPGGDVAPERGVCTDVIIRAMRQALALDLQQLVHSDMRRHFNLYPKKWGLKKPDRNIDHRRVPNLQKYFSRHAQQLKIASDAGAFAPGDIVTCTLPGNLPHIMLVSDKKSPAGTPLVIHNIGQGTREEDCLMMFPLTGHYRLR